MRIKFEWIFLANCFEWFTNASWIQSPNEGDQCPRRHFRIDSAYFVQNIGWKSTKQWAEWNDIKSEGISCFFLLEAHRLLLFRAFLGGCILKNWLLRKEKIIFLPFSLKNSLGWATIREWSYIREWASSKGKNYFFAFS